MKENDFLAKLEKQQRTRTAILKQLHETIDDCLKSLAEINETALFTLPSHPSHTRRKK